MIRSELLASLCMALAGPVFGINKCTGADGKTVFQDAPCMGKGETITVKPASGQTPTPDMRHQGTRHPRQAGGLRAGVGGCEVIRARVTGAQRLRLALACGL